MNKISNDFDDVFLKLFSKKYILKNYEHYKSILKEYLDVLNQILNYDLIFQKIDERFKDIAITPKDNNVINIFNTDMNEKITLCMIVKNEEEYILNNLEKHLPFFDEVVIVDTGSCDNTLSIMKNIQEKNSKLKLFSMKWEDDFSKARNYAKTWATNRWILFLDADEIIEQQDIDKLYKIAKMFSLFKYKNNTAFALKALNVEQNVEVTIMQRFFYNSDSLRYYGMIHEHIISNDNIQEFLSIQLNITITHYGYQKSVMVKKNKIYRNIKLLEQMMEKDPDNLRWLYYYVREGIGTISDEHLIDTIHARVKIDDTLLSEIVDIDGYLIGIIFNLFIIYLKQSRFNKCLQLLPLLEKTCGNNYDFYFYKMYFQFLVKKKETANMLKDILKYRREHYGNSSSYISNEGYHIDLMIAILLYDVGDFKKSKLYFEFLNGKIDEKIFFPNINEIISLINNY